MAGTCPTCRWAEEYSDTPNAAFRFAVCKRLPPTPVRDNSSLHRMRREWPEVNRDDWCGEHQPKKESK